MVGPGGTALQLLVGGVPGVGGGLPVAGGVADSGYGAGRVTGRLVQVDGRAVPAGAADLTGQPGWAGQVVHPIRPQPAGHDHRHVAQQPGQPGQVVAGVEDHQDRRVTLGPLPGLAQPPHHGTHLLGGHQRQIVQRPQPHRIQHPRPTTATGLQRGHERVRPPRNQLRGALAPPVHVAERAVRRARRVRPQPIADIHRQHDPTLAVTGQRQAGQLPTQPLDAHPAGVDRVVQRAMTPPVLGRQRQPDQAAHRSLSAQHRVAQLEQRIRSTVQTVVEPTPERRQRPQFTSRTRILHTDHRSPCLRGLCRKNHDQTRAARVINQGHIDGPEG
jgi:hypothetical protein